MLRYYIWIICLSMAIIAGVNIAVFLPLGQITIAYAVIASIINTIAVIVADGLIAYIIHKLPQKWFNPYSKFFKIYAWENTVLRKFKIRQWKDKVPEMGKLMCNFGKNKVASQEGNYLYKFCVETCYAEVVHYGMAFFGFILLLLFPTNFLWTITLPVILVNFVLQFPPIWIQRFNRPKLIYAYERSLKVK